MLKIAQIGIGNFGLNHLKILLGSPGVRVELICDRIDSNLKRAAEAAPEARRASDAAEVANDGSIDAVVIASNSETHHDLALDCLRKGKHCFVEKPLALSAKDAGRLVEEAEKRGKILMVGHLLEYHPAVRKLKEIVDSGELGRLLCLHSMRLNLGTVRTHENVLWSLAPHDLSVMIHLLNREPSAVSATGACLLQKGIHDVAEFTLFFDDGTLAQGRVSWLDPQKVRTFTVVGDKKMAVWNDSKGGGLKVLNKHVTVGSKNAVHDGGETSIKLESADPLTAELREFVRCVESGATPCNDGRDGLRVVRILEAAQHSLEQDGKPVKLP